MPHFPAALDGGFLSCAERKVRSAVEQPAGEGPIEPSSSPATALSGLDKRFGDKHTVQDLSPTVPRGEFLGLAFWPLFGIVAGWIYFRRKAETAGSGR